MPRYTLWFTRLPWLKQQHLPFNQQLLGGEVPIHKQVGHNYRGHISQLFQTYQCHDYVIVAMNTLRKSRVAMDNYDSCLLIKDFPWILPPLTTKNWGPPSVWTFAPWHPRPWPSKGLEHGPRRQKSGCNFWDVLQWHAMTMSWDMKSMDFWQCKHEFNIIMSKKMAGQLMMLHEFVPLIFMERSLSMPTPSQNISIYIWTCERSSTPLRSQNPWVWQYAHGPLLCALFLF